MPTLLRPLRETGIWLPTVPPSHEVRRASPHFRGGEVRAWLQRALPAHPPGDSRSPLVQLPRVLHGPPLLTRVEPESPQKPRSHSQSGTVAMHMRNRSFG